MANLKNTDIQDTESIDFDVINATARPTNPQEGTIVYNNQENKIEFWNGIAWADFNQSTPSIVENGLIFYLDPTDRQCFKPGDTTAADLVSGILVTGASGTPGSGSHTPDPANFPAYGRRESYFRSDQGIFDFSGGKGMNVEEDLGNSGEMTIDVWFFKTGADSEYITDARNDGGRWYLTNYRSDNISFNRDMEYDFGGSYDAVNPNFVDQWLHVVLTADPSPTLYINGDAVPQYQQRNNVDTRFGRNFRIGTRYTTSGQWDGPYGHVKLYNRALTSEEVKTNFEADRRKYDI